MIFCYNIFVDSHVTRTHTAYLLGSYSHFIIQVITKATADGTLYTKDWDVEPLFPMPNTDAVDKEYVSLSPLRRLFYQNEN